MTATVLPFVHDLSHIDVCVHAICSSSRPLPDVFSGVDVRTLTPTTLGRMLLEVNIASAMRGLPQTSAEEYLAHAEALETYAFVEPILLFGMSQERRIATQITALRGLYRQSSRVPGLAAVRTAGIIAAAMHDLTEALTGMFADEQALAIADDPAIERPRIPPIL